MAENMLRRHGTVIDYASPFVAPVYRRGRSFIRAAMPLIACVVSATTLGGCGRRPAIPIDAVDVRLVAQSTTWHASYTLHQAHATRELTTGREIDVPVGADVRLALTSITVKWPTGKQQVVTGPLRSRSTVVVREQ
jgi:hypothetical protein